MARESKVFDQAMCDDFAVISKFHLIWIHQLTQSHQSMPSHKGDGKKEQIIMGGEVSNQASDCLKVKFSKGPLLSSMGPEQLMTPCEGLGDQGRGSNGLDIWPDRF